MDILKQLGIKPEIKEITAYKTSKGALYEDSDLAWNAEKNIAINKFVSDYLSHVDSVRCDECGNYLDLTLDFIKFAQYVFSKLEQSGTE